MTTFAVCGDSWFSSDINHPGKSFGEIIAAKNNWNLVSLARGGCSNFAISLQIDKAIELESNFILVGCTTPDRIEIPIIDNQTKSIWEKLRSSFNWDDWSYTQPEVYKKNYGISNVWHRHHADLSNLNSWIKDPTIISESLNNLIFNNPYDIDTSQIEALKLYATALYDSGIKRQIDCWIMSDACRRLLASNIPFLFYIEPLFDPSDHWQTGFKKDIEWLDSKHRIDPWQFSYYHLPKNNAGSFHYDVDSGGNIFADYIQTRIKEFI
jgi:hypothetical protein